MRVLVTGGSGKLSQVLYARPSASQITFRVLSRKPAPPGAGREWATGDLLTGAGLPAALADVDAVLHLAHDPTSKTPADVDGTRHIVAAAEAAGVGHLLYLSIVGVDVIPYPYYEHKYAAERIVEASRIPWSILRATQFHSLLDGMLAGLNRFPLVLPVPTALKIQPLDDTEAADRLVGALTDGARGRLRDFAGPEVLTFGGAVKAWKRARRIGKVTVPIPMPGAMARALREGRNTAPDGDRGSVTWEQWLERRYGAGA